MATRLPFLALFTVLACGTPSPHRRTLIDSRDTDDPRSLDPALSTDVATGRAVGYVFDGLTRFDPTGAVQPALASHWEISPDGRTYTFHLRSGVHFQDGSPFSATSVVASWVRVLSPATRSGRADLLSPIAGAADFTKGAAREVSGLRVVDDTTLVVTLAQPLSVFLKLLAMPAAAIVPAHPATDFGEHPVGTGPWRFVEWHHDDYLLFARNPNYWGGPPRTDSLRARIIADPSTAVAEFESGNVDVLQVPAQEAREWLDDQSRAPLLQSVASLQLTYVALNTTRGPLRDVRVRQALNDAVDIDRIIQRLVGGRGVRAQGVIPPSLAGYDSARHLYAYDSARAKSLLAQAGYPNGLQLELWCSTNPLYARIAQTLQAYLATVGVRVTIVTRESAAARAAAREGRVDMILKDWYADYPDAENFLYPLLGSANTGAGGNVSFWSNVAFDSTMARARAESVDSTRATLYMHADSIAAAAAPMIFLYFNEDLVAVQPWVRGFRAPVIFNGQDWRQAWIDTTK